jgi:hypothetical protein
MKQDLIELFIVTAIQASASRMRVVCSVNVVSTSQLM